MAVFRDNADHLSVPLLVDPVTKVLYCAYRRRQMSLRCRDITQPIE